MVNEKDFLFIPPTQVYNPTTRTYEQLVIEEQPEQKIEQTSFWNINKQHYQSARVNEVNPSYGPGNEEDEIKGKGQHLISHLNKKCGHDEWFSWEHDDTGFGGNGEQHHGCNYTASTGARFGVGGLIADARCDGSVYKFEEDDGSKIRVINASLSSEAGIGLGGATAKARAGIDLLNASKEVDGGRVNARVGLNVDTGGSVGPGGVEVKFLGLGVSAGKKTGISTPFGEVSVESDDCVIQ